MKSLICTKPGQFEYAHISDPEITEGNAIIAIRRIGICGTDLHAYEGTQPYFEYPRILGHELAAEFVEGNVSGFEKGEVVTFIPYFHCGQCVACRLGKTNCCANLKVCGVHVDGGMVEYLSVPIHSLIHGQGLSYDELALVEPLSIAAHAITMADIREGEFVLVMGAGPIGLGIMELAKISGAQVIAMDINENRLSFCRDKMKVPYVINANVAGIKAILKEITHGDQPTLVIDATGYLKAILNGFEYMAHSGRFVLVGLQKENISFSHPEFHKREASLFSSRNATREDFEWVISSMKKGWINPANYITHRVRFEQVKNEFASWLDPANGVIKAMVEMR